MRNRFDKIFEEVLRELPPRVHELIEQVPLHVEDYPADDVLEKFDVDHRDGLCGLYTGIPLGHKSIEHSGVLPDVVTIYREGVLSAAADTRGHVRQQRLRHEIRVTILHELGHHHGLGEAELHELGYG